MAFRAATALLAAVIAAGPLEAQETERNVEDGDRAHALEVERVVAELTPEVRRTMVEGRIPSVTLALVAGDSIVWTGAFGESNRRTRTPATPSTVYLIGSTFKTMSATALLQLKEEGHFELDDPVAPYLDDDRIVIEGEDPDDPVTFRQIFAHVSGMPGAFGPSLKWEDSAPRPMDDYLAAELTVEGPPLEELRYSNMAYTLIGYLVQELSGTPFPEYVRTEIFEPLEMESTAFAPTPGMDELLSVPYALDEETGQQQPAERLQADVWPAGIIYGTIRDQARWLIANLNDGVYTDHRILSADLLDEMHTVQYEEFTGPISDGFGDEDTGWGLSWWVKEHHGDRHIAHSGSVPGYTAFIQGNLNERLGIALLTNGDGAHAHLFDLANTAMDLMKGHMDR